VAFWCMCQARGEDRYTKMAAEPVCEDNFLDAYKKCEFTVNELQSQILVLNGSVSTLTQQVSRCSAIHQEVFFHQYVRRLLQQLSKLAVPVNVYLRHSYNNIALVGCQEWHLACKRRVMRCWCVYLSGVKCE